MATYVPNTNAGIFSTAQGTIRKHNLREFVYTGTWSTVISFGDLGGWNIFTAVATDSFKYTFFGTGFEWRFTNSVTTGANWQTNIDGATNLTVTNGTFWTGALTTSFYGTGVTSFTASTGTLVTNTTQTSNGLSISGLSLGLHTVTLNRLTGTNNFYNQGFDIVTPIHSPKSNLYADFQNTLPVGNCSLSDNRKLSSALLPSTKAWAQAIGITALPTTSSTTFVPFPDMSLIIKTTGGPLLITAS